MTDLDTNAAGKLRTWAAKSLDAMRAAITRADAGRSDAAHQVRSAHVVDAATTAAANRVAAETWDALATGMSHYRPALAEFAVLRESGNGAMFAVALEMHPWRCVVGN